MLFDNTSIDCAGSIGEPLESGHISGLIEREYEKLAAQEEFAETPQEAKEEQSILNFFAGRTGSKRRRHEKVAQEGAIAYWRQSSKEMERLKIEAETPMTSPCQAVCQSPIQQANGEITLATVYNYRRKKSTTFTKLLALGRGR